MSKRTLEGKVAVITGGTRGIGRAIAENLAEKGCDLALAYLSDYESAEKTVKATEKFGIKSLALQCHIGQPESRKEFFQEVDKNFSNLDFFIANAATGVHRQASKLTLNSVRKVFAVNFESIIEMANLIVSRMPEVEDGIYPGRRGRVVALSSLGAERVIPEYLSVGASKAAIEALIRQLAFEWGPLGVNCNVVRAGLVDTGILNYVAGSNEIRKSTIDRTPNGRLVEPKDVASLVGFLLSDESAMINGQTMTVDGGFGISAG